MPPTVTFNVSAGALAEGFSGSPQALLNAFASSLIVAPSVPWTAFTLGPTPAPDSDSESNLGPWFKNGTTLFVWDDVTAAYIPQIIDWKSLQYKVADSDPGAAVYTLWVDTLAGALKWSNGAGWADIYGGQLAAIVARFADYSTTAQMNTAIDADIAAIPAGVTGNNSFRAVPSVVQNVVFEISDTKAGVVSLGTESFDPDAVFTANRFTVPVGGTGYYQLNASLSVTTSGGTPTDFDVTANVSVNGGVSFSCNDVAGSGSANGQIVTGSDYISLAAGDYVELRYSILANAAVTAEIQPNTTHLSGFRVR